METQAQNTSSADEEAVNKVAEKIDTLRMGPRQVRTHLRLSFEKSNQSYSSQEHEMMNDTTNSPSTMLLAEDLADHESDEPEKIVNIQPTAPIQSGITEQKS